MSIKRLVVAAALALPALLTMAQPAAASWLQQSAPAPPGATSWSFSAVSCPSTTSCMAVGTNSTTGASFAEQRSGTTWTVVSSPGSETLSGISCTSASACSAVGQSGTTASALSWNGTSWAAQPIVLPANATSSELSEVSCTSANSCEAVGEFSVGGTSQTLAEVYNGSLWNIQSSPNQAGATINALRGVSCFAANFCAAVGSSGTSAANPVTLAEVWNGSAWSIQTTPSPATGANHLDGVSCTSATACMATGTVAMRLTGTSWSLVPIAQPKGGDAAVELNHVSCSDRNHCMAAGGFFKDAIQQLVAEHWNGTKWQVQAAPVSTANDSSLLTDVSCANANACSAVGSFHNPLGSTVGLVEDFSLRWQFQSPLAPPGINAADLAKVSCVTFSACVAVGSSEATDGTFPPVTEIWNGRDWTQEPTPGPTASNLDAVACSAAASCVAVGDVLSNGSPVPLAEHWDGTSWTVQTTPNPTGAARSFLTGVSCTSASACTAVGFFGNSAGKQLTLAERWDGSGWTVQQTPNPAGSATSQLNEVSCSTATACTAVGSATGQAWAEAWNGTSWTIQSTPIPAGGSDPFLGGVSCTGPAACTAVGSFFNGTRTVPLADRWNGTAWTTQSVAVPAGSTASGFASVSCAVAGASTGCNAVGFSTDASGQAAMAQTWNGTVWSVLAVPTIDGTQSSDLTGVSCTSLTACMSAGAATDSSGRQDPLAEQYS